MLCHLASGIRCRDPAALGGSSDWPWQLPLIKTLLCCGQSALPDACESLPGRVAQNRTPGGSGGQEGGSKDGELFLCLQSSGSADKRPDRAFQEVQRDGLADLWCTHCVRANPIRKAWHLTAACWHQRAFTTVILNQRDMHWLLSLPFKVATKFQAYSRSLKSIVLVLS